MAKPFWVKRFKLVFHHFDAHNFDLESFI